MRRFVLLLVLLRLERLRSNLRVRSFSRMLSTNAIRKILTTLVSCFLLKYIYREKHHTMIKQKQARLLSQCLTPWSRVR
jgi:hypothetical protein